MKSAESTARRSFAVMMLAGVVMLCVIIEPIAGALLVAAAFASALSPLQRRLTKRLGGRPRASAGLLVFLSVVVFIGPLIGLSAFAVTEAGDGIRFVADTVHSERFTQMVDGLPGPLRDAVKSLVEKIGDSSDAGKTLGKEIQVQGAKAAAAVGIVVSATGTFLFQGAMMLIALFFLLVYGKEVVAFVDRVSPLRRGQTQELLAEFKKVSYSVVVSTLITALAQALAALIGYYIARVPHPVFFGALTFFTAMVPAVGAAVVCLVAALLLLITGHPYAALFLAIWG